MAAQDGVAGSWPAGAAAVPAARHLVREYLRGRKPDLVDAAELVVSELVGNVVLHVGGDVAVRADAGASEVLLEVSDSSALSPQLRSFSSTSSTGRGMRLVHSLSAQHGVLAHAGGKTVWVRLTAATAARSTDELAAGFADVDWLADDGRGSPSSGSGVSA